MVAANISVATSLLVWAVVAHLVADWVMQTTWMATHKTSLRHPASWAHAGTYALYMAVVFSWPVAAMIGISHLWLDTRTPLRWWRRTVKGMPDDAPMVAAVDMGLDQAVHLIVLAVAAITASTGVQQ